MEEHMCSSSLLICKEASSINIFNKFYNIWKLQNKIIQTKVSLKKVEMKNGRKIVLECILKEGLRIQIYLLRFDQFGFTV